ncbi:MAG TPA: methyltransferase, partial [Chloroflexota bacterium]|nr:methyltransferase [Chloroflexota bacterium]
VPLIRAWPGNGAWESRTIDVNGETVRLATKPGRTGFNNVDYAELLLAEHASIRLNDVVVNLQCRSALCGIVAARNARAGRVVLASASIVDVNAVRQSLLIEDRSNAQVVHSSGTGIAGPSSVDVVVARLAKGRVPGLRAIWLAYQMLRPGGRLYLGGPNNEGIQSSLVRVEQLFGNLQILAYRKGCRVGLAIKTEPSPATPDEFADPIVRDNAFHRFTTSIGARDFIVCSRPGVFSWDGLDPGAAALISAMKIEGSERVLDLGCGTGIVGVVAATRTSPHLVCLVDDDADAVQSAAETARANGIEACSIVASDGIEEIEARRFDVVVTNPPFHVGKSTQLDVAVAFIHGAAAVLRRGGRIYLVANRFLPYEDPLSDAFDRVETVHRDNKFKVLTGHRR